MSDGPRSRPEWVALAAELAERRGFGPDANDPVVPIALGRFRIEIHRASDGQRIWWAFREADRECVGVLVEPESEGILDAREAPALLAALRAALAPARARTPAESQPLV